MTNFRRSTLLSAKQADQRSPGQHHFGNASGLLIYVVIEPVLVNSFGIDPTLALRQSQRHGTNERHIGKPAKYREPSQQPITKKTHEPKLPGSYGGDFLALEIAPGFADFAEQAHGEPVVIELCVGAVIGALADT